MKIFIYLGFFIVISNAEISENKETKIIFNVKIQNGNSSEATKRYKPNWADLDSRPLPRWYDEAKVGIFLHWGVYSVPAFGSEWFWYYWHSDRPFAASFFSYQEFAPVFKAELFEPDDWAKLFADSGAKYIVLTSKHHDGYTLFPSKKSYSWNSVDVAGPRRDLVSDLSQAVREQGLKFGVYHSLYEWFNPIYLDDKKHNYATNHFVTEKLLPDLKQLLNEPSIIWADGQWEASDAYWESKSFLAWLYNDSPVKDEVVVNDRWGKDIPGKHGDFYNYDDRFNNRTLLPHKWENAFTVDSVSWGYRKNIDVSQILSSLDLLTQLVTTVSCGGNVLINVGPTKEGTIAPIFQERLLSLGKWLAINGEAIYKSSPWVTPTERICRRRTSSWDTQDDAANDNVWYTYTKTQYKAQQPTAVPSPDDVVTAIYAITLKWPEGNILELQDVSSYLHSGGYQVEMLGNEGKYLKWTINNGVAKIQLPDKATVKSEHAWTLKFTAK